MEETAEESYEAQREDAEPHTAEEYVAVSRADRLRAYFGWPGSTIHQLAEASGVSVDDLLYGACSHSDAHSRGLLAGSCAWPILRDSLIPSVKGNREFWIGVAESAK